MRTGETGRSRRFAKWLIPIVAVLAAGCTRTAAQQPVAAAPPAVSPTVHVVVTLATPRPAAELVVHRSAMPQPSQAVSGDIAFQSPSHNIRCEMSGGSNRVDSAEYDDVRCDALSHTWPTPQPPADTPCGLDYYRLAIEGATGQFLCVTSDARVLPVGPVLPYGQGLRDGSIICESAESGVKCTSQITGHGFTLSRQTYTLF